jgi:signal transduction histidine kinase
MQHFVERQEQEAARTGDRRRVEKVVETLATLRGGGESLAEVAHDTRNMVTALGLYCDLLEEPGVLSAPYTHYGNELRLVAAASRRLVEKLVALDTKAPAQQGVAGHSPMGNAQRSAGVSRPGIGLAGDAAIGRGVAEDESPARRWEMLPPVAVANLAAELLANRDLLSAIAGPQIGLTMETTAGARPVRLTGEDLTRVLVNVVKNAAETMPHGGRIHLRLSERPAQGGTTSCLFLTIEDNGPGIPAGMREAIFTSGYTTRDKIEVAEGGWPLNHRGLGLAITRSIVEAAGGRILAVTGELGGARFEIELPVR